MFKTCWCAAADSEYASAILDLANLENVIHVATGGYLALLNLRVTNTASRHVAVRRNALVNLKVDGIYALWPSDHPWAAVHGAEHAVKSFRLWWRGAAFTYSLHRGAWL